ncbi:MAG: hypothetical protein QXW79_00025 [Thermoplasmata archaeon]
MDPLNTNTNLNACPSFLMDQIGMSCLIEYPPNVPNKPLKKCRVGFFIESTRKANNIFHFYRIRDDVSPYNNAPTYSVTTHYQVEVHFMNEMDKMLLDRRYYFRVGSEPRMEHTREFSMGCGYEDLNLLSIVTNSESCSVIENIDVAVLVLSTTNADSYEIKQFAHHIRRALNLKAVIIVFIGRKTDYFDQTRKPFDIYSMVSKFLPIISTNGCVLFHDARDTYVMWSNGCFKHEWNSLNITENTEWNAVRTVDFETLTNVNLPFYDSEVLSALQHSDYISVGPGLFLNIDLMMNTQQNVDQLMKIPFSSICIHLVLDYEFGTVTDWFRNQIELLWRFLERNGDSDGKISRALGILSGARSAFHNEHQEHIRYHRARMSNDTSIDTSVINWITIFRNVNINIQVPSIQAPKTNNNKCEESKWSVFAKIYEQRTVSRKDNAESNEDYPNLIMCSICSYDRVPFILIRKRLRENDLKTNNNISDYCYNVIVCSKCASILLEKECDPMRVRICTVFPLISFKHPQQQLNNTNQQNTNDMVKNSDIQDPKRLFVNHFLNEVIGKNEMLECLDMDSKKQKFKNILSLFIESLLNKKPETSKIGVTDDEYKKIESKIENILMDIKENILNNDELLSKTLFF